jgi:four helix bundle protein
MASISSFEEFECWQLAKRLDNDLFPLTKVNGFERDYKLKDQILGASGSIMDNIAEGFERGSNAEFIRFLTYSKGSCGEVRSQLHRAQDRGYINQDQFKNLYDQANFVRKKLGALMNYLKGSDIKGPRYKKSA